MNKTCKAEKKELGRGCYKKKKKKKKKNKNIFNFIKLLVWEKKLQKYVLQDRTYIYRVL